MDEFTWWTATAFLFMVTTSIFAVMAWEYRRRSREMELSWRFDNMETMLEHKARTLENDQREAIRSVWQALESVEDRMQTCCQAKNCANKR